MTSVNTTRVSLRLKTDVYDLIRKLADEAGIDISAFIQDILEQSVYDYLPEDRREELKDMKYIYMLAQNKAKEVYDAGLFDRDFTLRVFREMMKDEKIRSLYEKLIGASYTSTTSKKFPLNMYLGWYIKNSIPATPILDEAGKPRRAYVRGEAIKSYTLLAPL